MTSSEVAVLSSKIEYLQEDVSDIKTMIGEHIKKEEEQYSALEAKRVLELEQLKKDYAFKWVEKVVTYVLTAIGCSLLGWFIAQQTSVNEFLIKNNYDNHK